MRRCLGCNVLIRTGSRCKACARDYRVPAAWSRAVKARDGGRCVRCGSGVDIAAHHLTPRAQGGASTLANGMALCARCHREAHRGG